MPSDSVMQTHSPASCLTEYPHEMKKIHTPTEGPESWRRLLADPVKHWRTGYSARTLAYCWEAADGLPPEVAKLFPGQAELLLALPEHKTPLPGGQRETQCDVFALINSDGETYAAAIEGKVDEPFGPTLDEWLVNASPGKMKRLSAMRALLSLPENLPGAIRYQLLHRTAAALIEAARFKTDHAAMVVHSFSRERRWFADYAEFCALLGIEASPDTPASRILPDGRTLLLGWATGAPEFLRA